MSSPSVRGMGVALMTSRCGLCALPANRPRCRTPKRCCSSTMARPRFLNSTVSVSTACVPTTKFARPSAIASSAMRFSFAFMPPTSSVTLTPNGSSRSASVAACWRAKISVGASMALCQPFCAANQMAAAATSVLPLPTSPCKSRFIGTSPQRSARISSVERFCAPVGGYGRLRQNGPRSRGCMGALVLRRPWLRSRKMPIWSRYSSSKISRRRAAARSSAFLGAWMPRTACALAGIR